VLHANQDKSVVIENETTNAAVDKATRSKIEPQVNVSPSGEIQVNNQSINLAQDHTLEANRLKMGDVQYRMFTKTR
jgi:hypothetical protein